MNITYKPEIRFADIDSYGIVHNANFLIYFEQSRISLFKQIAGGWDWSEGGVLVARQEVDYKHPVRLGDDLEIEIWVENLGRKSITCSYTAHITKGGEKVLCAISSTVIVCFNNKTGRTTEVPEDWKSAIERLKLNKNSKNS
jgi:acyl-CoA thioester hydrolase